MSTQHADIYGIVANVAEHDADRAQQLALDMIVAGLAHLSLTKGPRFVAEYCDMLAQDYTAEVLGHRRTTR